MADATTPYADGQIWDETDANWVAGFGDGTDGAFSESSGTTNLTQGTIHQYTSFLLDTNATLSASSTSDKPIIILVAGDCTINGTIDLKGKGQPANTGYYSIQRLGLGGTSNPKKYPQLIATEGDSYGGGSGDASSSSGGFKGGPLFNFQNNQHTGIMMNGTGGATGATGIDDAGGAGGASAANNGVIGEIKTTSDGSGAGTGGAGGCTLLIVVAGNLTFGASSAIDVSGGNGSNGTHIGGGGGGSGDILIFYNGTLTDSGVTNTVTGGTKGVDSTNGNADGGAGGAGTTKIVKHDTIFWGK